MGSLWVGPRYLAYTVFIEHKIEGVEYARTFSAIYFASIAGWIIMTVIALPPIQRVVVEIFKAMGMQFTGSVQGCAVISASLVISTMLWWRKSMFETSLKAFERSKFVKTPCAAVVFFFLAVLMAIASDRYPYGAFGGVAIGLALSAMYASRECRQGI